jgi:acyl-CoA reductase-like NAD-dependent aldehyde dehydrogenase
VPGGRRPGGLRRPGGRPVLQRFADEDQALVGQHHIPIVSELPRGGFKQSGYGKDMSLYAIEHYTELKHVMIKH